MSFYINNTYRIRRSALQHDAMKKLVECGVFGQYKDILMVSAIIGYKENKYVPIEKTAQDRVLMSFFSPKDYDIMDLLAFAHEKNQSIVKDDKKYEIFENYANGGFPILLEKLGVDINEEIDVDTARKTIVKYYMLLLSDGFKSTGLSDEDLFV